MVRWRQRLSLLRVLFIILITRCFSWMIKIVQNKGQAGEEPGLNLAEVEFFHHATQVYLSYFIALIRIFTRKNMFSAAS